MQRKVLCMQRNALCMRKLSLYYLHMWRKQGADEVRKKLHFSASILIRYVLHAQKVDYSVRHSLSTLSDSNLYLESET